MKNHFTTPSIHKEAFENIHLKWLVNQCQPSHTSKSSDFQNMIHGLNSKAVVPTHKTVKKSLHLKKLEAEKTIKDLLVGNFFSLTLDHWTSAANENYAELTLHTIRDFQLKRMVLSCVKHDNGSTVAEMDEQLVADLATWGLERYKRDKGLQLKDDGGAYNCPLIWWKENCCQYPFIWMLAEQILNIPASLAPSE